MFHLRELNDDYRNEIVNPSDADRRGLLGNLEKALQDALARVDGVKTAQGQKIATPTQGPGRVQSLIKFHETQQKNVTALDDLNQFIIRMRLWIFRQGAYLTVDGKIIWPRSTAKVMYDRDLAQQNATLVEIKGGLLVTPDGKPLDTKNMVTAFSGPGWAIYVVSAEGNLHVASHAVGKRHHSSLLAGADVACAGEMKVVAGKLQVISNKSGHYTPEPFYLAQVIRDFALRGLNPMQYQVIVQGAKGAVRFPTATAFLNTIVIPPIPEKGTKTIYYDGAYHANWAP